MRRMAAATVRTGGEKVAGGKGDAVVEGLGAQGTIGIGMNGADDLKALAQRQHGA